MANHWYFATDGRRQGPVSDEQLRQLAADLRLLPDDLIWKEGMGQWAEARRVVGLFNASELSLTPPPLDGNGVASNRRVVKPRSRASSENDTGMIVAGYVFAGLSFLIVPLLFGVAGIVFGIMNLVRDHTQHGVIQIVLSVCGIVFGVIVGVLLSL